MCKFTLQTPQNCFPFHFVLTVLIKFTGTFFKENCFSQKLFLMFSFKINSITLDPDSNSMDLDPHYCIVPYCIVPYCIVPYVLYLDPGSKPFPMLLLPILTKIDKKQQFFIS